MSILITALAFLFALPDNGADSKAAIQKLLYSYQNVLDSSNVKAVSVLYTTDAELLPQGDKTATGTKQISDSYSQLFKAIQLTIKFGIEDIEVRGDFAFARTHSQGTILVHASGKILPEDNRELFIFRQENGQWKIYKYMFNMAK
jgi:uncharacterized protein (TIGR02246 family)